MEQHQQSTPFVMDDIVQPTNILYQNDIPLPMRPNARDCKHYLDHGTCSYGIECKYNHPVGKMLRTINLAKVVNDVGLPWRPDRETCSHYMKYGKCGYQRTCQFHHPNFVELQESTQKPSSSHSPTSVNHTRMSQHHQQAALPTFVFDDRSYMAAAGTAPASAAMYPANGTQPLSPMQHPSMMMYPINFHHPYSYPVYFPTNPTSPSGAQASAAPTIMIPPAATMVHPGHPAALNRLSSPGQKQVCSFYLKNGTCKYGNSCRFLHIAGGEYTAMSTGSGAAASMFDSSMNLNSENDELHQVIPTNASGMHRMMAYQLGAASGAMTATTAIPMQLAAMPAMMNHASTGAAYSESSSPSLAAVDMSDASTSTSLSQEASYLMDDETSHHQTKQQILQQQ